MIGKILGNRYEILEEIEESLGFIKSSLEHPDENATNFWLDTARSLVQIINLKNTFQSLKSVF